jgi:flavin-dependent dehydrogenase
MANDRAVVMGASVAGLLAALVATEFFDEVVVVERDELVFGAEPRKGVPQGKQAHALLSLGMDLTHELIPDFADQLKAEGCAPFDIVLDVAMMTSDGWRVRTESTMESSGFRRPLFESVIRRNLLERPNCRIQAGSIAGLTATDDNSRVTGVGLDDGSTVAGDLIVDATGRGSQSPKWLEEMGYERPREMNVRCFMGYSSRLVKLPDGVLEPGLAGIFATPYPGKTRGGVLLRCDNGIWMLTASGMAKDYPPRTPEEFYDFLDDAPAPVLGEAARAAEPVTEIATYHQPGNQRRLWEELERRPAGFIVTGDAVGSYNPVYGQGMTQAAKAAVVLRDCLTADADLGSLPERFQAGHGAFTAEAFEMAGSADSFYEGVELENYEQPDPAGFAYAETLAQMATEDPDVSARLSAAFFGMRLEDLEADDLKAKAKAWADSGRQPTNDDGSTLPRAYPSPVS